MRRACARSIEHRAATVGASEIGRCARKTFYAQARQAERGPEHFDGWGAALRGTVIEQAFWLPALRARFGDRLKFAGDEQRQFKIGFISATPDALLVDAPADILASLGVPDIGSDCLLLECKCLDPRVQLDAPKPEHTYQAVVQLGVMRETTEFKPRYAVITYINASFWDDVTEFVVAFDPAVYASAKARAAKVLTAGAASELPPEGFIAGGHECERCPFSQGLRNRAPRHAVGHRPPPPPTRSSSPKSATSPSRYKSRQSESIPRPARCARSSTRSASVCAPRGCAASRATTSP